MLAEQTPLVTPTCSPASRLLRPALEIDYAPRSRAAISCSTAAPTPQAESRRASEVSLKVGSLSKSFDVVGPRV